MKLMKLLHWFFSLGLWYATNGHSYVGPFFTKYGAMSEASEWNQTMAELGQQPVWITVGKRR